MQLAPHLRHTYLFEPARWEGDGTYTDGSGQLLLAEGFALVLHSGKRWFIEGKMKILGDEPMELASTSAVIPFAPSGSATTWTSRHPEFGRLAGRLVILGDTFFSFFNSQNGRHNGSEWLRQIDSHTYEDRGVVFDADRMVAAWSLTMRRREAAAP